MPPGQNAARGKMPPGAARGKMPPGQNAAREKCHPGKMPHRSWEFNMPVGKLRIQNATWESEEPQPKIPSRNLFYI